MTSEEVVDQELIMSTFADSILVQTFYLLFFRDAPSEWFVSSTRYDMDYGIQNHLTKLRNGTHHDKEFQQMFDQHGEDALTFRFIEARILRRDNAVHWRASIIDRLAHPFPFGSLLFRSLKPDAWK